MKQIVEDYCNFETAKLLKEKGFDNEGVSENGGFYCDYKYDETDIGIVYESEMLNKDLARNEYLRPTHQMALKWLREVHKSVIEINMEDYMTITDGKLKVTYSYTIWTFIQHLGETGLTDARYVDRAFWQENVKVGQSFEEASEAAIKYCLENLIL